MWREKGDYIKRRSVWNVESTTLKKEKQDIHEGEKIGSKMGGW